MAGEEGPIEDENEISGIRNVDASALKESLKEYETTTADMAKKIKETIRDFIIIGTVMTVVSISIAICLGRESNEKIKLSQDAQDEDQQIMEKAIAACSEQKTAAQNQTEQQIVLPTTDLSKYAACIRDRIAHEPRRYSVQQLK